MSEQIHNTELQEGSLAAAHQLKTSGKQAAFIPNNDQRPEAVKERSYQQMADNSLQVGHAAGLQAMVNSASMSKAMPVQRKAVSPSPASVSPNNVVQLTKEDHAQGDLYYGISTPRYDMATKMGAVINTAANEPVSTDNMNAEAGVTDTFKGGDDHFKGYFDLITKLESNSYPVNAGWPAVVKEWVDFLKAKVGYLKIEKHYNKLKARTGAESRSKDVLTKNGQPPTGGKTLENVRQAIIYGYDNKTSDVRDGGGLGVSYKPDLNGWLWDVFFRRTSKMGIDFTVERAKTIHMNMHVPGRGGGPDSKVDKEAFDTQSGGAGRTPITFSEMRHIYRRYGNDHANIHLADYKTGNPTVAPANNPEQYEQMYMATRIAKGVGDYAELINKGSAERFKKYYGRVKMGGDKTWPEILSGVFNEDAATFRTLSGMPKVAEGLRAAGYHYQLFDTVDYFKGPRLRLVSNLSEAGAPQWSHVAFGLGEYYYYYPTNTLYTLQLGAPASKRVLNLHGQYLIHDLKDNAVYQTNPMKTPVETTAGWAKTSDNAFYLHASGDIFATPGFDNVKNNFTTTQSGLIYYAATQKAYNKDTFALTPLPLSDKLELQIKPTDEELRLGWHAMSGEYQQKYAGWVRVNCNLVIRALMEGRIEHRR